MTPAFRIGLGRVLATCALVSLSACFGGGKAATPPTTTLALPPDLVALVSVIGAGSSVGSGTSVYAVDLTTRGSGLERSIAVGTFPDAVAVAPNAKTAYVANYADNTITPINLVTGRAERSIPAGQGPAGIAITPNGKTAYVTDAGTSPIGNTVTPINLRTKRAGAPITVGAGPQGIVITPDGAYAYVADAGAIVTGQNGSIGDTVTPIDLRTNRALAPITVGNGPLALAVSPDGSTVYVTNANSGSVTPIDVSSNTVGVPVEVDGSPQAIATTTAGAWVADAGVGAANNLTPIAPGSSTAGPPIPLGKALTGVAITPDGRTAWVVSSGTNSLIPVDLASATVEHAMAVSVPGGPYAVALVDEPMTQASSSLAAPTTTTAAPKA